MQRPLCLFRIRMGVNTTQRIRDMGDVPKVKMPLYNCIFSANVLVYYLAKQWPQGCHVAWICSPLCQSP